MKDKHSREDLLKGLDLIPEYVGLDTKWKEQIKSLLTPIPEEKLKEFESKWRGKIHNSIGKHMFSLPLNLLDEMLKEYDKLKESSDEE